MKFILCLVLLFGALSASGKTVWECTDEEVPDFYMEYVMYDRFNMTALNLEIEGETYISEPTEPCTYYATPYLPFYFVCEISEEYSAAISYAFAAIYKNKELDVFKTVFECVEQESEADLFH